MCCFSSCSPHTLYFNIIKLDDRRRRWRQQRRPNWLLLPCARSTLSLRSVNNNLNQPARWLNWTGLWISSELAAMITSSRLHGLLAATNTTDGPLLGLLSTPPTTTATNSRRTPRLVIATIFLLFNSKRNKFPLATSFHFHDLSRAPFSRTLSGNRTTNRTRNDAIRSVFTPTPKIFFAFALNR